MINLLPEVIALTEEEKLKCHEITAHISAALFTFCYSQSARSSRRRWCNRLATRRRRWSSFTVLLKQKFSWLLQSSRLIGYVRKYRTINWRLFESIRSPNVGAPGGCCFLCDCFVGKCLEINKKNNNTSVNVACGRVRPPLQRERLTSEIVHHFLPFHWLAVFPHRSNMSFSSFLPHNKELFTCPLCLWMS